MFCFAILRIFGGNRKKKENWKIWGKIRLLHHSVGNPRRGVDLRQGVGYPRRCEVEVPKRDPYASGEGLRRSVATVHSEQFLDFCFRTPRIRTLIV